jgi:hypothetical protein
VFHAVELLAGLTFGGGGVLVLLSRRRIRRRRIGLATG